MLLMGRSGRLTKIECQSNGRGCVGGFLARLDFSFVPAHGACRAGAVAQQLSRTLTEGLGVAVLLADFDRRAYSVWSATEPPRAPGRPDLGRIRFRCRRHAGAQCSRGATSQLTALLDYARAHFAIVCADLTGAQESHALSVLRASDGIFVVSGTDGARLKASAKKWNGCARWV